MEETKKQMRVILAVSKCYKENYIREGGSQLLGGNSGLDSSENFSFIVIKDLTMQK